MAIELRTANIEQITVGERFRDDYADLDTLAASLKKEGIIQPLAVRACVGDEEYILLAGGRRYKACCQAGITEIPVRVYPETLSELEMRSIELMENVARKDLSWHEATNLNKEIHVLQQAIYGKKTSTSPDAPGVSLRDTAELLGKSFGGLSDDIKLANAIEVFPTLKEAKTKSDAMKMLKKLQENLVMAEINKRIQTKTISTPLEELHQEMMNKYHLVDFFEGIKNIPDGSVDIVELDPPYAIDLPHLKKADGEVKSTTYYNEVEATLYADFMQRVFSECYRVMSDNSWIICWFAQEPWFEFMFQAMKKAGFTGSRIAGIWDKDTTGQTMNPATNLANSYETFFYMRKGFPNITRQGRSNVFTYKMVNATSKIHPTERPVELIQEILQTFSWEGARVLVPFLGSGNTMLAASNLNMPAFGFDLSEEYKNGFCIRVVESRPGAYKSYREE